MSRFTIILIILGFVTTSALKGSESHNTDIENCLQRSRNKQLKVLGVLPGKGWDNLQNRNVAILTRYNYSLCRTTSDGKYLLPNHVFTVPRKATSFELFADVFEHWTDYKSTTASTVNAKTGLNFGFWKLQGSFSSETMHVREMQMANNTATTRIQMRYTMYTVRSEPDPPLHETFKNRLLDIAKYIDSNKTDLARYKSQLLVRDFGTHVLTSEDAGATILQMDEVKKSFLQSTDSNLVKVAASVNFQYKLNIHVATDAQLVATKSIMNRYIADRTHSDIKSHGGPVFRGKNNSFDEWTKGIEDNVVAIDRAGDPIYHLITEKSLPELSPYNVYRLSNFVRDTITAYYKVNTYFGCTKTGLPNFSFQSNVDDGSCDSVLGNYTFGGVYQTCERSGDQSLDNLCSGLSQVNPMTGKYACPKNFRSIPLVDGVRYNSRTTRKCLICRKRTLTGAYRYKAYWCAATKNNPSDSGFLFGGTYTSSLVNLLTKTKSCPKFFYPLKIGEDLHVCVSSDHELGLKYSAPFAGLFSCKAGNPLNLMSRPQPKQPSKGSPNFMTSYVKDSGPGDWPRSCPKGYSQHLAALENGCEIQYCLFSHAVSDKVIPDIKRPPFMAVPKDEFVEKSVTIAASSGKGKDQPNEVTTPIVATVLVLLAAVCIAIAVTVIVRRRKGRQTSREFRRQVSDALTPNKHVEYGTRGEDNGAMTQEV